MFVKGCLRASLCNPHDKICLQKLAESTYPGGWLRFQIVFSATRELIKHLIERVVLRATKHGVGQVHDSISSCSFRAGGSATCKKLPDRISTSSARRIVANISCLRMTIHNAYRNHMLLQFSDVRTHKYSTSAEAHRDSASHEGTPEVRWPHCILCTRAYVITIVIVYTLFIQFTPT